VKFDAGIYATIADRWNLVEDGVRVLNGDCGYSIGFGAIIVSNGKN